MRPDEWIIVVGVPLSVYIALLAVSPIRRASKDVRVLLSANLMWVFLLGAWGYIWEWENEFSFDRYLGLFILPVIGTWLGFLLWKWSGSTLGAATIDSGDTSENRQQENETNDIGNDKKEVVQFMNGKWYKSPYLAIVIPIIIFGVIFSPDMAHEAFISALAQAIGLVILFGVFYGIKQIIDKTKESNRPGSN